MQRRRPAPQSITSTDVNELIVVGERVDHVVARPAKLLVLYPAPAHIVV